MIKNLPSVLIFVLILSSILPCQNLNKVNAVFPFFDDVEDSNASKTLWEYDSAIWQVKTGTAHSGSQFWAMLPTTGNYNYITFASSIDLSGAANPYLSLWTRKADGGSGYLSLETSVDGGTNWTVLLQPNFSGNLYTRIQVSLNNYRQANVLIRIGCYAPYGNTYHIDDIMIDNAPTPQSLLLLSASNNGMTVKWGQSTAADFYSYRVVLSTDQNAVNNYFLTSGISGHSEHRVFDIFNKATIETTLTDLTFANMQYYAKIYEQDNQDLINQGSDRVDLPTTFTVTKETVPFVQDFESSYLWAADIPWNVTTDDASDEGHSETHAYEDSPNGSYPPNADRRLVAQINFGSMQYPVLKFNHKYSYELGNDFGYIDFSTDNVNWTTITGFTGNSGGLWETREFDAGILKSQSNGYIRFRTTSNSQSLEQDGWHLDDIEIYNNTRTTAFPFFDDISVDTVSAKNWITGSWNLKIAADHSGDGQVLALPPSGGNYVYLTLGGPINLSSASNPYISFWVKKNDGGSGYVSVEVSNNGGGSWTVLAQPNFSGTQYTRIQASLANYKQSNIVVRVGAYAPYGDTYYLDDILIDNAPTPRSLTLLNPTNNGMRIRWGESTAADFYLYRAVISTDQNQVNNFYAATGISGHTETRSFDIFSKAVTETTLTNLTFTNTQYYVKIYEQDTQDLVNQGSDRIDLATTFLVTVETAPFMQDFESSFNWAADIPWAVTETDSADEGHSKSHAFEDSPDGNYPANSDRRLVAQINLLNVERPVLKLNHKYSFEENNDFGVIDFSIDNVNWTYLASFTGNSGGLWEERNFDLGSLSTQPSAFVRFKTQSNSSSIESDGWHLDDIEIINNNLHSTLIPFIDSVEVDSVTKDYWVAGIWEIQTTAAHSGTQVWYCPYSGGNYNYLTLSNPVHLSNAPKPFVSFWIKRTDGSTGYLSFEVSNDGGKNWTVIQQPNFSGDYSKFEYSLADYKQPNIVFRIGVYSPYGAYYLDDITFADSTGFISGVWDNNSLPTEYKLYQNYPNPFNPSTNISYDILNDGMVSLIIYNITGEKIAVLKNEYQYKGRYIINFSANNLSSGIYFYKLSSGNFIAVKKMILIK